MLKQKFPQFPGAEWHQRKDSICQEVRSGNFDTDSALKIDFKSLFEIGCIAKGFNIYFY